MDGDGGAGAISGTGLPAPMSYLPRCARLTSAARPPCVESLGADAKRRRDMETPDRHRHVFQEMDLLIGVGEMRMCNRDGGDAPYRQHQTESQYRSHSAGRFL